MLVIFQFNLTSFKHYANMPMQFAAIFKAAVKMIIVGTHSDCISEVVLTSTHILCFGGKNNVYPGRPQKVGFVFRFNVPVNNFSVMSGQSQCFLCVSSTFGE